MLAAAFALLLVATPPAALGVPADAGGLNAWRGAARDGRCGLPARVCARRAFDLGKTDEAFGHLQAAAAEGDTWAMRAIGVAFMRGEGVAHDPEQGVGWFFEAALRGDKEAMRLLGASFREGLGVERDPRLAAYWTQRGR